MSNFFRIGSEGRNPLSFLLHGPVTSRSDDQVPNAPPAETAAEASDVLKKEYHTVLKPVRRRLNLAPLKAACARHRTGARWPSAAGALTSPLALHSTGC